jgi:hypothetical protein
MLAAGVVRAGVVAAWAVVATAKRAAAAAGTRAAASAIERGRTGAVMVGLPLVDHRVRAGPARPLATATGRGRRWVLGDAGGRPSHRTVGKRFPVRLTLETTVIDVNRPHVVRGRATRPADRGAMLLGCPTTFA